MNQNIMNRRYSPRSLQGRGGAHSVLLRMAENEERAARIADLKERQPLLTWKKIADKVGVSERSTHAWRKTGAISPENAAVLADIFDVDFDYLWFGPKPGTPELFVDRRNTPKSPVAVDRLDGELADRIDRMDDTLQEVAGASRTFTCSARGSCISWPRSSGCLRRSPACSARRRCATWPGRRWSRLSRKPARVWLSGLTSCKSQLQIPQQRAEPAGLGAVERHDPVERETHRVPDQSQAFQHVLTFGFLLALLAALH
jgi:hypothetical protein